MNASRIMPSALQRTGTPALHLHKLAATCAAIAALALPGLASGQAPANTSVSSQQSYAIEAGPLASVLPRFAAEAGVQLSADAQLTQGIQSAGLQGPHSVTEGFAQILRGTRLQAVPQANGIYVLMVQAAASTSSSSGNNLPEVVVSAAPSLSTEGSSSYGSAEISVFKGTQSLRQTPQPVTVVTRQLMEDQALTNLQDVLTTVAPGITINYADSERISYYARGHQIDSLQTDGMSSYLNGRGSSGMQPDVAILDRIEVVRGATGLMRGAGSPSASVNMVRKMPTRTFQASTSLTAGSWDKRRAEFDISGPLNEAGSLRGRFVTAIENQHLFQKVRHDNRRVAYGVLEADLTPNTQLRGGLVYSVQNATGAWGGVPANPDGTQLGLPRDTYLGSNWNAWNRDKKEGFIELEHAFANDWNLKVAASHTRAQTQDWRQTYYTPNATNPLTGTMAAYVYEGAGVYQSALNATANGPFELLGRKHELVLGLETQRVRDNSFGRGWTVMENYPVPDITQWDPYAPLPISPPTGQAAYQYAPDYTRQSGLYASSRLSLADSVTAIVGARLSWWSYQVPSTPAQDYSVTREVTPYLGVVWDFAPQWSAYAGYTEIFTPQRAWTISNSIIEPIRGEDYEAGVKADLMDGKLHASFSVFRINNVGKAVDDTTSPDPCLPSYTTGYCKIAGGKTRSQGWEAEVQGQITPAWNISGGYTNTNTKYLRDSTASNVGAPLRTLDPKHILRLYTSYRFSGQLSGLSLGAGVQAQSDKYATARGVTYRQGGLALYNAMASYALTKDMRVQLNVNNIFDKTYFTQVGSGLGNYYGTPRNWQLSLNARF